MMFADRSDAAVSGLQRAFALERDAAKQLIADAPIVVKRSATPEVAAALIDVLNQLGAQVVLLPSAAPRPAGDSVEPEVRADDTAAVTWGGLDLGPAPLEHAFDDEGDVQREPEAAPRKRAAVLPDPDELFGTPPDDVPRGEEREDSQEFDLGADASDEPPPLEPLHDVPRMSLRATASASTSLPPLPPAGVSVRPAPPAVASMPPVRVSARPSPPSPPPEPPASLALPNLDLDLGLGPLPALPAASTVRSLPPRPPAIPSQRPQVSVPPVPSRRPQRPAPRTEPGLTLQIDPPKKTVIEVAKKPVVTDNYWSARRSVDPPLFTEPNAPAAAPARAAKEPTGAFQLDAEPFAAKAQVAVSPRARVIEPRKRTNTNAARALAALAGAAALGGGVYLGDSVLAGSASNVSIALHGIALWSLACGVLGLPLRSRWQPLWLTLAGLVAFGSNQALMARVPYELSYGERTMPTGTLSIDDGREMKLATIHVVALDVERRIGPRMIVRELWLRSPELRGEGELDIELFAEFGRDREVDANARSIAAIEHHDLRVLPLGRGSTTRSRLRLPGASTAWLVHDGSLRVERAQPIDTPGATSWHVQGTLDLELRDGRDERHVHGTIDARVTWN